MTSAEFLNLLTPYLLGALTLILALISIIWRFTYSMIKGLKKNQDTLVKMVDKHELLHTFTEKRLDKLEGSG